MMLGSVTASWLFTSVFAAAALGSSLPLAWPGLRLRPASRAAAGFCVAMCAALITMTWWAEPKSAVWLRVAASGAIGPGARGERTRRCLLRGRLDTVGNAGHRRPPPAPD
jgi:hypothetical protein